MAGFGPPEYLIIDWLVLMGCLSMMARWSTAIGAESFRPIAGTDRLIGRERGHFDGRTAAGGITLPPWIG